MKRFLVILAAWFAACAAVAQTGLEGAWHGTLQAGGAKLTLVLHLGEACSLDSPEQGAFGIEARQDTLTPYMVKVTVPKLMASYQGVAFGDKLLGTFTQAGQSFPLTLERGDVAYNRPQTPQPPFPYPTREVTFGHGDVQLAGTLAAPQDARTALVLVSGSGLQDRDETLFYHRPFLVMADALARAGIATLRYDDRGCGESTGPAEHATTIDFARDAAAALAFLRTQGYERVGVLGHSEGGTIAFMLASPGSPVYDASNVPDFLISEAGMIATGRQTLESQLRTQLLAAGVPESQAEAAVGQQVAAMRAQSDWMRYFLDLDPSAFVGGAKGQVLALFAEKDMNVMPRYNVELLRSLLPSATVKLYAGLNHLFQHCATGMPSEYVQIEETIAPEVLGDIISFVKSIK